MSVFSEIEKRHDHQTYDKYGMLLDANQIFDDREKLIAIIKSAQQEIQDELDTMGYGNDHPENELLLSIVEILEGKS